MRDRDVVVTLAAVAAAACVFARVAFAADPPRPKDCNQRLHPTFQEDKNIPSDPSARQPNQQLEIWLRGLFAHQGQLAYPLVDGTVDFAADPRWYDSRTRVVHAQVLYDLLTNTASIPPPLRGIRLAHAVVVGDLDVSGADIPYEVEFRGFYFVDRVNFSKTRFRRGLSLVNSVFARGITADNATVDSHLLASGARFLAQHDDANGFKQLIIGGPVDFHDAVLTGETDFTETVIGGLFTLRSADLINRSGRASEDIALDLERMRIGGSLILRNAEICGETDGTDMIIGGPLLANRARFDFPYGNENNPVVNFSRITVGGTAFFAEARFVAGPIDLSDDTFKAGLVFNGAVFKGPGQVITLSRVHVEGPTTFASAYIDGCVRLDGGSFASLDLSIQTIRKTGCPIHGWDVKTTSTSFDAMRYEHIQGRIDAKQSNDVQSLLDFFGLAPYSPALYADLEAFYKRSGYSDRADAVFFERKRREQETLKASGRWLTAEWQSWQEICCGYGRRPYRALAIYGLYVLGGGLILFLPMSLLFKPVKRFSLSVYPQLVNPWNWWGVYNVAGPWPLQAAESPQEPMSAFRWWCFVAYLVVGSTVGLVGLFIFVSVVYAITGGDIVPQLRHYVGF